MAPVTLLVGSFHTHLQLLEFEPWTSTEGRSGTLSLAHVSDPAFDSYTWIAPSPVHSDLFYAAQSPSQSGAEGIISVIRVVREDDGVQYRLEILQSLPTGGMDPCHAGISSKGDRIAIANYYTSNVTLYDITSEGLLRVASQKTIDYSKLAFTTGPDAERQDAAHPHMCHPVQDDFIIPDLGGDKLRWALSGKELALHAGAGPRHVAMHPNQNYLYTINELDNTLTVHSLASPSSDGLSISTTSVLPSDCDPSKSSLLKAAAINLTPDSKFIYTTNRLEDHPKGEAIVWFSVSQDGKDLTRQGEVRSGLQHLRGAELFEHDGKLYYITGSKTEKGAVVYERDPETGDLTEVARNNEVVNPSCFVKLS